MKDTTSYKPRCPVCKTEVCLQPRTPTFPFCSKRCRQIDLGRWLGEAYAVPLQSPPGSEDDN